MSQLSSDDFAPIGRWTVIGSLTILSIFKEDIPRPFCVRRASGQNPNPMPLYFPQSLCNLDSAVGLSHGRGNSYVCMLSMANSRLGPSKLKDESLLNSLARRYYKPLLSFFRKRTHNDPDTHDLVQQVFLRLAQSRQQGEIHDPDAYIFQTAANALRDHYRHLAVRNRHLTEISSASELEPSHPSTERVVLAQADLARLVAGMRKLPERTRDIVILRCFEGLKNAEIAELQHISTRSVEKHIAKGLAALSQILDSGGT